MPKTQSKTHSSKSKNRILSVTIKRMVDDSPDTSWLGEYGTQPKSEYTIDRRHSEDCASIVPDAENTKEKLNRIADHINSLRTDSELDTPEDIALNEAMAQVIDFAEQATECDCGGIALERHSYEYFNPCWENYKGESDADIRKYCRQDYDRMESLNAGNWCFIGMRAEARVILPQTSYHMSDGSIIYLTQTLSSGGLWGIESDSEPSYIESEEQNQLTELRDVLLSFGFSRRAIAMAFKTVKSEVS
jgi:hypothetical protein